MLSTEDKVVTKTTKSCRCGSTHLVEFASLNRKRCSDCRKLIYWPLTKGQEPLNGSHRAGRRNKDKTQ